MRIRTGLGVLICCGAGLTACTAAGQQGPAASVTKPAVGRPAAPASAQAALSSEAFTPYAGLGASTDDGLAPGDTYTGLHTACMNAAGLRPVRQRQPAGHPGQPRPGFRPALRFVSANQQELNAEVGDTRRPSPPSCASSRPSCAPRPSPCRLRPHPVADRGSVYHANGFSSLLSSNRGGITWPRTACHCISCCGSRRGQSTYVLQLAPRIH
jgi:hypothetical protein